MSKRINMRKLRMEVIHFRNGDGVSYCESPNWGTRQGLNYQLGPNQRFCPVCERIKYGSPKYQHQLPI